MRSRYVHATGRSDVLLDENFLEQIAANPLYTRQHTKVCSRALQDGFSFWLPSRTMRLFFAANQIIFDQAIRNDTAFLQRSQVMDYSLLLGIDETNHVRSQIYHVLVCLLIEDLVHSDQ